jgi:glycosyltransferase involved in cell wall biosynthesis
MARVLAHDGHQVVLATTSTLDPGTSETSFHLTAVAPGDQQAFGALERDAQVIVFQGHAMEQFPVLTTTDRVVVVDAYDPMHLEMLEQGREQPRATWELLVKSRVALLNQQLARADFVLCASQRQRSLYIGQLAALGRVSPATYESDPHLRHLIGVVPFGLEAEPPRRTRAAVRGVVPGIDGDSRVLLWGGGIYSWFDPLALIRAVHALAQRRPQAKLVFLGTKHPGVPAMGVVADSIDLARDLGALGSSVVFNEDWVPYNDRGSFLLEANAGVSTHHAHVETEFSFRTRILDYLWAGLPMVVTEGDTFADLVETERLGLTVPAGDDAALEAALEKVLFDDDFAAAARARVEEVRERFLWETVLEPLREIVSHPRHAADIEAAGSRSAFAASVGSLQEPTDSPGLRRNIRMGWHYLRHGGVGEVVRRVKARRGRS